MLRSIRSLPRWATWPGAWNRWVDDDPVGCNWLTEVQAESAALSDAATAYGLDPSTANCLAFVEAYQNYLAALEANLSCAGVQGNQAQQAEIDAAQAQLDNINC